MKLLIETAMIFFGTLMAAALLALGGPAGLELVAAKEAPATNAGPRSSPLWAEHRLRPASSTARKSAAPSPL